MGQDYMDSNSAEAEADIVASIVEEDIKQVCLSLRKSLQVIKYKTRRMLKLDPDCMCNFIDKGSKSKWERRNQLDDVASVMEYMLCKSLNEIGCTRGFRDNIRVRTGFPESVQQPKHPVAKVGDDDSLLWCNRVCVHEKVDMDRAVWCSTPQTIMELVFARLPLPHMFRMRGLSKHWRAAIASPSFQHAFGTTTRFAIVANVASRSRFPYLSRPKVLKKGLWSFGTDERKMVKMNAMRTSVIHKLGKFLQREPSESEILEKMEEFKQLEGTDKEWYMLPFDFLPTQCNNLVAGGGGLLCCWRQGPSNRSKDLYVCNPLTQAWRKLPLLSSQVQGFDLVHMVTNKQTKQYTITVVSDDLQPNEHHNRSAKAVVEVYNSARKTWSSANGDQSSGGRNNVNLFYYKKYVEGKFVGIRAYNTTTGYSTSIPCDFLDEIVSSEMAGFFPLVEHQGQIYVLRRIKAMDMSGVWVLRPPSHTWTKLYSVPEFYKVLDSVYNLKYYLLIVSTDTIAISGHKSCPGNAPNYFWMLDRAQEKWIDMIDHERDCLESPQSPQIMFESPQIMFEMRLDVIP